MENIHWSKFCVKIFLKKVIKNLKELLKIQNWYSIIKIEQIQKKSEKEAQNMKKAKTFAGVERERERERVTTLINNNQAKRLALLSIYKTDTKYLNT